MSNTITETNAQAGPTFPTIAYNFSRDIYTNQALLVKTMKSEREAHALKGYCFVYSEEEISFHSKANAPMGFSCHEMMRAARDENKSVKLFRNMNGEMACKLI